MTYKFKEINVLIVDSQPPIVELIKGVLQMFGVQKIAACHDAKMALKLFYENDPDIMIVDWDLADISGIEFTKNIRSSTKNPYVPIIFMTALSSKRRVSEARDSGITEFLSKPFTADSLYKRIEAIIEKPRPFVRATEFFGPDRRRSRQENFTGVDKRGSRASDAAPPPSEKK